MARKSGLGRGLQALIPVLKDEEGFRDKLEEIEVTLIDPNPEQPRLVFHQEDLKELSDSIKNNGVIQPIIVTRNVDRYTLIAGERRWRATQLAGYEQIPAVVKDVEPGQMLTLALLENIQRRELNPIEEALAYEKLLGAHQFTHETLAEQLGKSRVTISNTLRLLRLSDRIKNLIQDGKLSFGHARCLITIEDQDRVDQLADACIEEGWSVRELERRVADLKKAKAKKKAVRRPRPKEFKDHEKQIAKVLKSKVSIAGDKKKGKIVIQYASEAEYQALLASLIQENGA